MSFDYYSIEHGTLATRLDRAWEDYKNNYNEEQRKQALDFMIYVFDIRTLSEKPDALNEQLSALMQKREEKKADNPEYIPIMYSGVYDFEHTARILVATHSSKKSGDNTVMQNFMTQKLLDVNDDDKLSDYRNTHHAKLDAQGRSEFRLEIHNGLLCKNGKPFDSKDGIAHDKQGYVAFTLNSNGELSVFNHLSGRPDAQGRAFTHSSMNAGVPVLAAGEMVIQKGKLVTINTFSGHYQPSLYSVSRFLKYLNVRRVDLSKTNVLLQNPPSDTTGLKSLEKIISGDPQPWHEVQALQLMSEVEHVINHNMSSINDYLKSGITNTKLADWRQL